MVESNANPKPDGAAFDDIFERLGKRAEQLTSVDKAAEPDTTNDGVAAANDDADDRKVVDEIESLCMNCHRNV